VKRPGRPREVENPVRVSVRVSSTEYDYLDRIAKANDKSVPTVIRHAISALTNRPQNQTMAM
jgi:predicted transcriptional regulator